MSSDLIDQLKSLHTSAIDARNGYRRALEDSDKAGDLSGLFQKMADLHQKNADELTARLTVACEKPDDDGSFMSTIHRTIMDVRALFGGLDKDVLPGLIDGEERNVKSYDDALELASTDADMRGLMSTQRTRLTDAVAQMKTARSAA